MVIEIENKYYIISEKELELSIKSEVSMYYKRKITEIMKEQKLREEEVLEYLIDYYYLDNVNHLHTFFRKLSKRLSQGVDRNFIIKIRTIYTVLGHFLRRLRYI